MVLYPRRIPRLLISGNGESSVLCQSELQPLLQKEPGGAGRLTLGRNLNEGVNALTSGQHALFHATSCDLV
ncbi:MAG TPA: hypothetical protein DEP84_26325 [Chloroflexi bacterium]|nr:hypothetical protein [Chloroflexota bacterium]